MKPTCFMQTSSLWDSVSVFFEYAICLFFFCSMSILSVCVSISKLRLNFIINNFLFLSVRDV